LYFLPRKENQPRISSGRCLQTAEQPRDNPTGVRATRPGQGTYYLRYKNANKRLRFLYFLKSLQLVSVPHNPLVPGSSPGGPAIDHKIHGRMASGSSGRGPLAWGMGVMDGESRVCRVGSPRLGDRSGSAQQTSTNEGTMGATTRDDCLPTFPRSIPHRARDVCPPAMPTTTEVCLLYSPLFYRREWYSSW